MSFDAVVLAKGPHANEVVLGLTLAERGRRVAARLGARRVVVVTGADDLATWADGLGDADLLVLRAGDQLVHMPLVEPLLAATGDVRIAVDGDGTYAGAIYFAASEARRALAELAKGTSDTELASGAITRVPHGPIARHAATTPAERRAAAKMLMTILVKSEDSPVSKYIYRPLSRPLTRLLVGTPVTPNGVSYVVAVIGLIGCWFVARPGNTNLVLGSTLVLVAGIIDGCDGELARLRLTSSKFGAWLDTVVDELTTFGYFLAAGLHFYGHYPAAWVPWAIVAGCTGIALIVYVIYYFLIFVSKTGNSQHYIGDLVLDEVGGGLHPRPRAVSTFPPWARKVGYVLMLGIRRDFINLGSVVLAILDLDVVIFIGIGLGGVVTPLIIVPEHFRLRAQLREIARRGAEPRLVVG